MKTTSIGVKLNFTEDILGSWPADPEVLTRFISKKAPAPWLEAEEGDCLPERTQDSGFTVFPQDHVGIFLWNYHLKGFLKEAGNTLKDSLGVKNLRAKIDNYVFVQPRRLYIYRNSKTNGKASIVEEPDDILERPLRGQTAQGPRVTLVGSERIKAPVYIEAVIELVPHKELDMDLIRELLNYGRLKGISQWRNGGFGTFEWEEAEVMLSTAKVV